MLKYQNPQTDIHNLPIEFCATIPDSVFFYAEYKGKRELGDGSERQSLIEVWEWKCEFDFSVKQKLHLHRVPERISNI